MVTRKRGSKSGPTRGAARHSEQAAAPADFAARLASLRLANGGPLADALSGKDLDRIAKAARLAPDEVARLLGSVQLERQSGIPAALLYHLTQEGETPTYSGLLNKPPEVLREKLSAAVASGELGHDAVAGLADLEARRSRYETITSVAARANFVMTPRLRSVLRVKKVSTLDDVVKA